MVGHFRHILGTMGMSEWVDGGALPVTPTMRVSHTVSEMRERRGETQRRGEKRRRRRRRRRRSAQTPPPATDPARILIHSPARWLERETRQGEEAGGAATAPWPKPAALSPAQCPIAAHLHRSRAPHGPDCRAPEAGPDERAAAPGQNEGHLHPKRRFRRSFLAF